MSIKFLAVILAAATGTAAACGAGPNTTSSITTCQSLPSDEDPFSIAWSADGTELAVASARRDGTSASIRLISWPSRTVRLIASSDSIQPEGGVAIGRDGTTFWLVGTGATSHVQQSDAGGAVSEAIALPDADFFGLRAGTDGLFLWHEQPSGGASVTKFTGGPQAAVRTDTVFATDKFFSAYWISAAGDWLVATTSDQVAGPATFSVTHTGTTTDVRPDARLIGPPAMTPDHALVVFPNHDLGEISAVPSGGGPRITVLNADAAVVDISSSRVIAYVPLDGSGGQEVCFHAME